MIPLGVTVSTYRFAEVARARAREWQLPFFDRPARGGLTPLLAEARGLLVLGGTGWRLKDALGECGWSPGMSRVRIKRLHSGVQQPDALVLLGELSAGDVVVDATLGAGSDALVCAHVVGPEGRVLGFEASRPLYLLASEGLRGFRASERACLVEPRFGEAEQLLAGLGPGSADCVMIDAMFERQKGSTPSFEVLRRFAVHRPLTPGLLEQARGVARRWVVVKVGRYGGELKRLGLTPVPASRPGPLEWARLPGRG